MLKAGGVPSAHTLKVCIAVLQMVWLCWTVQHCNFGATLMHVMAATHYCMCTLTCRGTGNNAAVQRLLHFAVSDVSDDVRRAAVLCLGFVLLGAPEQCPKIVALLAESFNPHVRYGAAMAIGIACAGKLHGSRWGCSTLGQC